MGGYDTEMNQQNTESLWSKELSNSFATQLITLSVCLPTSSPRLSPELVRLDK